MKKAPLGLILFLYIGLLSGVTQSQPNRNSRMDSEWKTKRGRVEDDAIIVDNDDELDSSNSNGEKKELFITGRMNSNNRMASLEKRQIVSVDNDGKTHPGTPEAGNNWPEYFRPLPKEKRTVVSVDNDGQVSQDEPETEGSKYFRPLTKRQIVDVDNEGQVSQGEPETEGSKYFRPLTKREIVDVDNNGQVSQGKPETEGSEYFRPLPKTKRNMMKYAKLPLSEKRSEDCVINPSAAEWELEKCCKIWFPAPAERSAHNLLFRACSSGNHL